MTIVEFINARLDEDEAKAFAAARESGYFKIRGWAWYDDDFGGCHLWDADDVNRHYPTDPGAIGNPGVWGEEAERMRERARASRCDLPAQTLRDVKAKRAILAAYSEHADLDTEDPETEYAYGHARGLGLAARHMAAIWSNHPNYDPAWAPVT